MTKAVVLLSAGLDSTVNLFAAKLKHEVVLAITFDYGQRAAQSEITHAKKITEIAKINHLVLKLDFFKFFNESALLNEKNEIPTNEQVQINDLNTSHKTAKSVWVPNRNGIFLNIAAGFAENLKADFIVPGFNLEEAQTFPDNTQEFADILSESFTYSTANKVKVKCFTSQLDKTNIVKLGKKLNVPFELIWPCYFSGEKICGQCESCLRYNRAMSGI